MYDWSGVSIVFQSISVHDKEANIEIINNKNINNSILIFTEHCIAFHYSYIISSTVSYND